MNEDINKPVLCGVSGCSESCVVFISKKNIARCAKHYQEDVDAWGKHHKRGTAQRAIRSRITGQSAELYQSVKSGTHLMQILKSFCNRGRKAQS